MIVRTVAGGGLGPRGPSVSGVSQPTRSYRSSEAIGGFVRKGTDR
jgi:hypothetical protein